MADAPDPEKIAVAVRAAVNEISDRYLSLEKKFGEQATFIGSSYGNLHLILERAQHCDTPQKAAELAHAVMSNESVLLVTILGWLGLDPRVVDEIAVSVQNHQRILGYEVAEKAGIDPSQLVLAFINYKGANRG